tara:strand:+ start:123 stop:284 length:162 start_codon:yes stop_codon:yes gene_type:complete
MNENVETKLKEICDVIDGKWYRTSIFNSRGETEKRIIISYSSPNVTGSDTSNT